MSFRKIDPSKQIRHNCHATREGDWVIYRCSDCDYEMHDNLKTGETRILNSDPIYTHRGEYISTAFVNAFENRN